eukprot:GHVU01143513.1.p1 GENE.GHVU01143513.1~~GHVU01143513.1.p1  ORF type:complete len:294 (-),score=30.79 GHVU01143513.1:922-1803(-)
MYAHVCPCMPMYAHSPPHVCMYVRMYMCIFRLHLPLPPSLSRSHARTHARSQLLWALLCVPPAESPVPVKEILRRVYGLSYNGDIRMRYAERPDKVIQLLTSTAVEAALTYVPLLTHELPLLGVAEAPQVPPHHAATIDRLLEVHARKRDTLSASSLAQQTSVDLLSPQHRLDVVSLIDDHRFAVRRRQRSFFDMRDVFRTLPENLRFKANGLVGNERFNRLVAPDRVVRWWGKEAAPNPWERGPMEKAARTIVRRSSEALLLKNFVTAGQAKAVSYLWRKLGRRWRMGTGLR